MEAKKVTKKKTTKKKATKKKAGKKISKKKTAKKKTVMDLSVDDRAKLLGAMVREAVETRFEPVIKEEAKKMGLDIELNVHLHIKNYSLKK